MLESREVNQWNFLIMVKAKKRILFLLSYSALILFLFLLMQPLSILHLGQHIDMLFPKGAVAFEERNLLLIIQAIMLLVIIPVYILTFIFSWRYRANNGRTAKYDPDLVDHRIAEYIWWGVPVVLILVISGLTWIKTYQLDPYKPIPSEKKPITIQVVALQWKWLFIYPEEKIASVNFLQIPEQTPVHFEITADAPMNSFWIPRLGGQIYAMPKMKTELYLIADQTGDFQGYSANLSGEGFAGMHFTTRASSEEEYRQWVASVQRSPKELNQHNYDQLAAPSKNNQVELYQLKQDRLFEEILHKYMHPPKLASPE